MKDRMDIEDLFKGELGNQKVVPTSKSFSGLQVRHFMKKIGVYILTGSAVVALGVVGTLYLYNAAESTGVKDLSDNTPSSIQGENVKNTEQNKKTIAVQVYDQKTGSTYSVSEVVNDDDFGSSNVTEAHAVNSSVTSDQSSDHSPSLNATRNSNQKKTSNSIPTGTQFTTSSSSKGTTKSSSKSSNKSSTQSNTKNSKANDASTKPSTQPSTGISKAQKASESKTNFASNNEKKIVVPENDSKAVSQDTSPSEEENATKQTNEENTNQTPTIIGGDESIAKEEKINNVPLKKEGSIGNTNEGAESKAENKTVQANNSNTINKATTGNEMVLNESEPVPETEIKQAVKVTIDSAVNPVVALAEVASENPTDSNMAPIDSTKRKRKLKFSLGALYVNQMNSSSWFDYNSFFSYSLQSGIKYPFFKNKIQLNTGIDYTYEMHHFFRTNGLYGQFTEVNEIHLLLRKFEIPLSIDYKLPIKGKYDYRGGMGIKFSKIFFDDEEAWNDQDEIVEHPEEENSFIVDGLHPTLNLPFLYLHASKDLKKIRANLQLYYYFRKRQMDGYSDTFVSEYFNPSSLRVGLSIDF